MSTIEDIIYDACFFIETLYCPTCKKDVDFKIDIKTPRCYVCGNELPVTYEDLKPVGLLPKRAGILRYKSTIA